MNANQPQEKIKVAYHRINGGVSIWVYKDKRHLATFTVNKKEALSMFKGEGNLEGKCPKCGTYKYAVFYMPYGKNKYDYCPKCDKDSTNHTHISRS